MREGDVSQDRGGVNMTVNYKGLLFPPTLEFLMMTERHN